MKQSSSTNKANLKVYPTAEERQAQRKDKVAESLAVYTPMRGRSTMTVRRRIAGISASNEVWRFAAKNDLLAHLETAVRLAKECFRRIEGFHFTYDIDPEIENESYITIRATVYGTVEELLPQDWALTQALARSLSGEVLKKISFFPAVG